MDSSLFYLGELGAWARETSNVYVERPPHAPRRPLGSTRKLWKAKYKGYKPQTAPRFPKVKRYNWRAEIASAKAAHARALRTKPQNFRLTGDLANIPVTENWATDAMIRERLIEQRYLNWKAGQANGR